LLNSETGSTNTGGTTDAITDLRLKMIAAEAAPAIAPGGGGFKPGSAVAIVACISTVAALYWARAFVMPLLIGLLASYALRPVVDLLGKFRVPRALAAALVILGLTGGLTWIVISLADDAAQLIEKLPEAARKLRLSLSAGRSSGPTALQNMQEAANQIEGAAADVAGGGKPALRSREARDIAPAAWLRDYMLAQSVLLFAVAAQTPILLLLVYFLLASGVHFRRKLVSFVGPSFKRKKETVKMLEEVDVQVQRYLLTMLISNVLVAVFTWIAFAILGMEQAGLWGVAAGILHFIPYLGPLVIAVVSGAAAFLQFGSLFAAGSVAVISLLVAGAIGFVFTTWLQSRYAGVNAAVLFIAFLFFGWLWGVGGLLLSAPLVAIAKVIFDHVDALKPAGHLLGRN